MYPIRIPWSRWLLQQLPRRPTNETNNKSTAYNLQCSPSSMPVPVPRVRLAQGGGDCQAQHGSINLGHFRQRGKQPYSLGSKNPSVAPKDIVSNGNNWILFYSIQAGFIDMGNAHVSHRQSKREMKQNKWINVYCVSSVTLQKNLICKRIYKTNYYK